jgi:hypothetical protein
VVRPVVWRPSAEPSPAGQAVIKAVRRAKLFVFLRLSRHELLDEEFQAELADTYVDSPKGQPPVPPARLALATILQAYEGQRRRGDRGDGDRPSLAAVCEGNITQAPAALGKAAPLRRERAASARVLHPTSRQAIPAGRAGAAARSAPKIGHLRSQNRAKRTTVSRHDHTSKR